jgi:hypothetical protein
VKVYVDMDVWIPVFSASVLGGDEWSDSRSGHVISGKVPGIHCLGGRVDLIADLGGWRKKSLPSAGYRTMIPRTYGPQSNRCTGVVHICAVATVWNVMCRSHRVARKNFLLHVYKIYLTYKIKVVTK